MVVAGCEADSGDLGLRDASTPDAALADAGPADGGPTDAGGFDAGPTMACGAGGSFEMAVEGFGPDGYEGPLEQTATGVSRLATPDQSGDITFFGETPQALLGQPGFWARLEVYRPFWTEARLTLWRLGPDGEPADLAVLAWSGSSWGEGAAEGVRYRYADQACEAIADDCGRAVGAQLVADARGERLVAGYGRARSAPTFEIFNGRSHRYVQGPRCPDTPGQWYAGWIASSATRPPDCASLQRDVCIASPRCVLWGSETLDPGYLCVPARGECEPRVGPEACADGRPGCVWDPGECYCPEDEDCFCGGGPAPKCRAACGSVGGPCPEGRYCDQPSLRLPLCQLDPNPVGRCEWIPTQCSDIPSTMQVCACGPDGPQVFDDDCVARQNRASDRTLGPCPD